MLSVLIVVAILGIVFYLAPTTNSQPSYKKSHTYNSYDSEMKFLVDSTSAVVELVKISKRKSLEKGYSYEVTRDYLFIDINNFRKSLQTKAASIAVQYGLTLSSVKNTIDSVCDSAIDTYVFNL